jgi:hypothetical protein
MNPALVRVAVGGDWIADRVETRNVDRRIALDEPRQLRAFSADVANLEQEI